MQNIEELVKLEMKNSPFNKVGSPKLPDPGSKPWMKYGVVLGAIGIAVIGAIVIYKYDQKQKNGRD